MSNYGSPDASTTNTLKQISDARQRALTAVSQMRVVSSDVSVHPNLAPVEGDDLPIIASQAVADYLLQLHPYRPQSRRWGVDFGVIELPDEYYQDSPRRGGGKRVLNCVDDTHIPVGNASEIISAINTTITYSTDAYASKTGGRGRSSPSEDEYKVVFQPGQLIELVEHADAIAEEMGLLAEITPSDHSADEHGVV